MRFNRRILLNISDSIRHALSSVNVKLNEYPDRRWEEPYRFPSPKSMGDVECVFVWTKENFKSADRYAHKLAKFFKRVTV